MKPLKATLVSAVCLTLAACSVNISDDGVERYNRSYSNDRVTVTLPNGDRDGFTCPEGTSTFVINRKDEGLGMAYGCRTNGSPMPVFENDGVE